MKHNLKIFDSYFDAILQGLKTFEIRKNDRGYMEGDELLLHEIINVEPTTYTGRVIYCKVPYITTAYQRKGYIVMSIKDAELINGDK